ncbi:radical SAM protein [Shimia thalassica]|uniref:radical SAM protein n=1 Tax=Shimia thalassica TaxID=1715693 RepID=UPI002733D476|nr:radical SAM protein [Shimia thalassica]MDP2520891.1 radical SAM protein [Shimia thalassica]
MSEFAGPINEGATMNCEILRTLYVKANGEVLCNDDMGEQILLGSLSEDPDSSGIVELFENEKYQHIRNSFQSGDAPWPGICENCALFRPDEPFSGDLLSQKVIQKIQLETSLACALKCPSCSGPAQLRSRLGSVHLSVMLVRKLMKELSENGYKVENIEFCGQGEPLNHPKFQAVLKEIQDVYPDTRLRLITNGNHDYVKKVGDNLIHETIVSIDGAFQDSYEKYRVNGKWERAATFLKECLKVQRSKGGKVIWKYILFTSNDSDEEIVEAQRIATDIGVDRLWFVHGHGDMRSTKFTFANASKFPLVYPRVKVESHPSYNRAARSWNNLGPGECVGRLGGALWLDTFIVHANDTVSLIGWVNAVCAGFDKVRVSMNDGPWMPLACDITRADVIHTFPQFIQENCGFDALVSSSQIKGQDNIVLFFSLTSSEEEVAVIQLELNGASS